MNFQNTYQWSFKIQNTYFIEKSMKYVPLADLKHEKMGRKIHHRWAVFVYQRLVLASCQRSCSGVPWSPGKQPEWVRGWVEVLVSWTVPAPATWEFLFPAVSVPRRVSFAVWPPATEFQVAGLSVGGRGRKFPVKSLGSYMLTAN